MTIKTDLNYVRKIAECFLNIDIAETKIPFVASHPFTDTWHTMVCDEGKYGIGDLHDEEVAKKWREQIKKQIEKASLLEIFMMLNKAYILNFLKFVSDYMSNEDLGMVLANFWQMIEVISLDNSISGRELVNLFKRADKEKLMNEDEREIFDSLPSEIIVYRGVTSYNKKKKKAFSWTTDRKIAEWFANRFSTGTGEIWTLTIPKDRVLCTFDGREREVIVNLYGYKGTDKMKVEKI